MPVILISLLSAIIIFNTVYSMIKVLNIAYKREEISILKYRVLATFFIGIGMLLTVVLPFGYQRLFDQIL
jgi:hypothetical protein